MKICAIEDIGMLRHSNNEVALVPHPETGHLVCVTSSEATALLDGEPRVAVFADEESGILLVPARQSSGEPFYELDMPCSPMVFDVVRGKVEITFTLTGECCCDECCKGEGLIDEHHE